MAKLASAHTTRTELRDFAAKMIALQQQEIDKMSGWLKSWYNISPKEVANEAADKEMKMHMSMFSGKKDADFDKAFLEMMPKHHHAAVEIAEQAEKKATHSELKEFAAKIAKDQEQEIKQMKGWAHRATFKPSLCTGKCHEHVLSAFARSGIYSCAAQPVACLRPRVWNAGACARFVPAKPPRYCRCSGARICRRDLGVAGLSIRRIGLRSRQINVRLSRRAMAR